MSVKQISVFLENKKGRLAELTDTLEREGINMRALSLADTTDFGVLRIIVDDVDRCLAVLRAAGFVAQVTEVIAIEVDDKPGRPAPHPQGARRGRDQRGVPLRLRREAQGRGGRHLQGRRPGQGRRRAEEGGHHDHRADALKAL